MPKSKKPSLEDYPKWLENYHNIRVDFNTITYHKQATERIKTQITGSSFWKELNRKLIDFHYEYQEQFSYKLLLNPNDEIKLLVKTFKSSYEKSYRINIQNNNDFPEVPFFLNIKEWRLPTNWYSNINDILRCLVIVKYLDGVKFLVDKITSLCKEFKIKCRNTYQGNISGYYAAHIYIKLDVEPPPLEFESKKIFVTIEIQISTQLQEIIRNLLHKHYEKKRISTTPLEQKWQWDYRSEEFATNYLGHILHYIEGMIMDIREKQKEG